MLGTTAGPGKDNASSLLEKEIEKIPTCAHITFSANMTLSDLLPFLCRSEDLDYFFKPYHVFLFLLEEFLWIFLI